MKPRLEPRPRGRLLAKLLDDPWRKLASLALAVAVWLWLSARTDERFTADLLLSPDSAEGQPAPLNKIALAVPRDQMLVTGFVMPGQDQPVNQVQVTVFGQKKDVEVVRRRGMGFVVDPLDHERVSGRVDITASRLTLDYEAGKLTFELSPPKVEARLARIGQRLVTLETSLVRPKLPDREEQRARVQWPQDVQFSPGQVTLVGPRQEVDALPPGPLFRVDLAKDDLDKLPLDQTLLSGRLQLLPEIADRKLRMLEATAEVRVRLLRRATVFTLELAPELDFPDGTPPQERALWSPPRKTKVQLKSYSPALTEILSKSPAEVYEWAHKNCRLKANMAAFDKASPRIPTVFYMYKDGQEFLAGTDYDVVLDPVLVEPAR